MVIAATAPTFIPPCGRPTLATIVFNLGYCDVMLTAVSRCFFAITLTRTECG